MESGFMKAVIKPAKEPGVKLAEVPIPTIGATDVLIKIKAASICGSDLPIFTWDDPWTQNTIKPGEIIGHEFCGEIADIGGSVTNVAVGDFVVVEGHLNCGSCTQCRCGEAHVCPNIKLVGFERPGAFAEFIAVPASNVLPAGHLPLSYATLLDPLGCAMHAVSKAPLANNTVLITGCGPIGLMTIALAKMSGARKVFATEINQYRRDLALKMGADLVLNPHQDDVSAAIKKETLIDSGIDVYFEMSGDALALQQGFQTIRSGGQAVLLGLANEPVLFDFANDLIAKGITVHGVIGRTMYKTWIQAQKLLDSQLTVKPIDLKPIITHHFFIDEFEQAMKVAIDRDCGKVIIYPDKNLMP